MCNLSVYEVYLFLSGIRKINVYDNCFLPNVLKRLLRYIWSETKQCCINEIYNSESYEPCLCLFYRIFFAAEEQKCSIILSIQAKISFLFV